MNRIMAVLFTILMAVSVTACGGSTEAAEPAEESVSDAENAAESVIDEDPQGNIVTEDLSEPENDTAETEPEDEADDNKILVAYFSATNTTEGVAETIADMISADLYEIMPEEPYTEEDLNYNDKSTRATVEMNDSTARPSISGSVENMEQYDIVFIGYPIWWGDVPRIVSTFAESYDFSGKTIIPFCTSGSSGIGSSASHLEASTEGAVWLSGTRFSGSSSRDEIEEWVNGLGLNLGYNN